MNLGSIIEAIESFREERKTNNMCIMKLDIILGNMNSDPLGPLKKYVECSSGLNHCKTRRVGYWSITLLHWELSDAFEGVELPSVPARLINRLSWYQWTSWGKQVEDTVDCIRSSVDRVLFWNQLGWGNVTLLHKLRKVWKPGRGTNCWFLQQHGWILNTFCLVKEARPKGHMLYYGDRKEMSYLPEVVKAEIAFKRASQWNFWDYENVLLHTVVVDNDSIHLSNHTG